MTKPNKAQQIIGDHSTDKIEVAEIKAQAKAFIDIVEKHGKCQRRKAVAITHIETAAMFAVKSFFTES